MKIVHVVRSLDPQNGGPPVVVLRLATELARQGHDVELISQKTEAQSRIDEMTSALPDAERIKFRLLPAARRLEKIYSSALQSQLEALLQGVGFVHLHGVWDPLLKAAATVAWRLKIPYAIAPHGMLDPWSLAQKSSKKKLALLLGYRAMLNRVTFLHLLNDDEKELIKPLNLSCQVRIIPNGVDPKEFDPLVLPGQFYAAHPELSGKPYILFLSRLHYKKGLDFLAAAYTQLATKHPLVQLVVAGPDDGAAPSFRQAVKAANLEERVHMVGPIFGRDRFTALVDAACFCLPSRQEGFSMAILEAMACGRPVIITDACHFPQVATTGAGEVVPLEVESLTNALDRVLSDHQRAENMGRIGRALVMERYTWPIITARLVDNYQSFTEAGANIRTPVV